MKELITYDHNVLFITLDCCRWDTYQKAATPNLDKIGEAKKAQTPGNYTLPAHSSFFVGHLPKLDDDTKEHFYTRGGAQLWRLTTSLNVGTETVGVKLVGSSILEGYRAKGYSIRGFGGTHFFDSPKTQLRSLFEEGEFHHFGFSEQYSRRDKNVLPLSNPEKIAESVKDKKNWFVFINESATHFPYHIEPIDDQMEEMIKTAAFLGRQFLDVDPRSFPKLGLKLHQLQVQALEYVDNKVGVLLNLLPKDKPLLIVICADHGESFGEDGRWGHINNGGEVLTVPLLINTQYTHQELQK